MAHVGLGIGGAEDSSGVSAVREALAKSIIALTHVVIGQPSMGV